MLWWELPAAFRHTLDLLSRSHSCLRHPPTHPPTSGSPPLPTPVHLQRTLRELEVGRTLVRDREGRWVIRQGAGDYKTGRAYGERPPLLIDPAIYPELEAFMDKWRAYLEPQHGLLFTQ